MKIHIDEEKCVGSGQCALTAPEVFDVRDDDGVAYLLREPPLPQDEALVREAADFCPTLAITFTEDA